MPETGRRRSMLAARIATAAVLLGALLVALFLASPYVWLLLCALCLVPAGMEWGRLSGVGAPASVTFGVLLAAALFALRSIPIVLPWNRGLFALAAVFWVSGVPLWLRRRPSAGTGVLLSLGALVLLAAFAALAALRTAGSGLLLGTLAIVWVSDTAAMFCGERYGRHKLAPAISPAKTWEGAWGAMAAVCAYATGLQFLAPGLFAESYGGPAAFVPAALVLAVLGMFGDLFESHLKRCAGVKDSGHLLPGHGGLLDRIDALLPVLPVAAWWFGQ